MIQPANELQVDPIGDCDFPVSVSSVLWNFWSKIDFAFLPSMLKIAGCPLPLLFPPPLSCWGLQIVRASYEVCNLAGWMDRPNTASALARCPDEMLVCPSYPSLEWLCDEQLSKLNLQKNYLLSHTCTTMFGFFT